MQKKYVSVLTLLVSASIFFPPYTTLADSERPAQVVANAAVATNASPVSAPDENTAPADAGLQSTVSYAADAPVVAASSDSTSAESSSVSSNPSSTTDSAADSSTKDSASSETDMSTLNLSLDDALKMVETGNSDLKLTDQKIQIYEKQNKDKKELHDANITVVDEDTRKDRDLNYKWTQWTLDNAKHDRENQLKDLKVDITNQYQTILSTQQQADNIAQQIKNLDTTIEQVNLQIKLGLVLPSEIYKYNAQRSGLEAMQNAALNSIKSSMNTLKNDLGIDLNRPVVLTSPLTEYKKFDSTDIDQKILQSAQNNYDIQRYKQDIEISQLEHDIDFFYNDTTNADTIQLKIEDKKSTLENLPKNKELELRNAYNSLKSLENTVEADRLTVEADQINIDVMKKNVEVGQASTLQLLALQTTQLTDENTLQKDIIAYMTAAANFQNSLDE